MDDLPNYRDLPYRWEYTFDCPVGVWRARLDAKAWGKQKNILLYFSEGETAKKYCISLFKTSSYGPEEDGVGFRHIGQPGQLFELETAQTRTGRTKLISAKTLPEQG